MSSEDFKSIWLRDNASLMIKPTIDRVDSSGHYEIKNCRYIEMKENSGRHNKEKKFCPRRHAYTPENTIITPLGYRQCRECRRIYHKQWYDKKFRTGVVSK
jgi:hypothetical protein